MPFKIWGLDNVLEIALANVWHYIISLVPIRPVLVVCWCKSVCVLSAGSMTTVEERKGICLEQNYTCRTCAIMIVSENDTPPEFESR